MVTDPLDAVLLGARQGDETSFRQLWRQVNPRLLRYLAVRDPARFEDLAAETWLQVVRDLEQFDGDAQDFRAWLFALARHRCIDAWRTSSRQPTISVTEIQDRSTGDVTELTALERLSTAEAVALIRTLPSDQADVLGLRLIADLDVRATAEILGKSTGAVRVLCHRGLRTLAARQSVLPSGEWP
ncbi:RNA polymerase sigma factor [Acidothermaceae bacterium B102]|nr:RNA polymerase sigma factor [Acidothermaceae bacterium B102]